MRRLSFFSVLLIAGMALLISACAPGNPHLRDAERSLDDQDYEQALAYVETALEEEPNNAQAYVVRGQIYQDRAMDAATEQGDARAAAQWTEQMMQAYNRAVEIDPDMQGEVETRRFFAYGTMMEEGVEHFNEGSETQSEQAFSDAADYFEAAGYIEPDSAAVFQNQAFALINAGREMEAIEPLESVVELGVEDVDVYAILGNLYALEERWDDATRVLEEGRDLFPESDDIQSQLVNVYLQAGETEEALNYYADAVQREPDNATYRYNYGSILLELERTDEAIEQLEQAVQLGPEDGNAYFNLGAAYTNIAYDYNQEAIELDTQLDESEDPQERQQIQQEMQANLDSRNEAFENAIPHLEEARNRVATTPNLNEEQICVILFQAYVHTDRSEDAQRVSSCAGMDEEDVMGDPPQDQEPPMN